MFNFSESTIACTQLAMKKVNHSNTILEENQPGLSISNYPKNVKRYVLFYWNMFALMVNVTLESRECSRRQ